MSMEKIRSDFDRLAAFDSGDWNHNNHYHPYLLGNLPHQCAQSLEIGCGAGAFARLLAARSQYVLALDLSPEMIRIARERSADFPNIEYRVADVLEWPFPAEQFDCIASIATLHHLPLDTMLAKIKTALKPGGTLLVLDLFNAKEPGDFLVGAIAFPINILMSMGKAHRSSASQGERLAWNEHSQHDHYLDIPSVRRICREILPGAIIKRHLFWRYSIVWQKPADAQGNPSQ